MSRIVTTTVRIASICLPDDVPLSIAAAIFVAAGVVLIYVINMIFTQRIIRAQHPNWGWNPIFKGFFLSVYVIIVLTLTMLITSVVQSYYTLSTNTHRIDRDIQLYGATMYMVISFLPIPIVTLSLLIPRNARVDKFGSGRFRTKIAVLLLVSLIICCGATYRCATSWLTPVPRVMPTPWYYRRTFFYVFDFTVEVLVVYLYAFLRVDRRFHVPNGAHGPGSYRAGAQKAQEEKRQAGGLRVYSEEETFDDAADDDGRPQNSDSEEGKDVEAAKDFAHEPSQLTRPEPAQPGSTLHPPHPTAMPGVPHMDRTLWGSTNNQSVRWP